MTLSTSATPINGEEALKMLKRQFEHLIDNTPGLDFASSYHRFTCKGEFQIGAYPADVKTPRKEFEFDIDSVSTKRKENEEIFDYVKRLETIRAELMSRISQVDELLDKHNPVTKVVFDLTTEKDGQSIPDALRVEQGLPVPVVVSKGGRNVEVYKQVEQKSPGVFGFARGRK